MGQEFRLRLQSGLRSAVLEHHALRRSNDYEPPKWVGKIRIVYDDGPVVTADFVDDEYDPEISGIEEPDAKENESEACEYTEGLKDAYAAELSAYLNGRAFSPLEFQR